MIWLRREWPFAWTWFIGSFTVLSTFLVASYHQQTWPFQDRRPLRKRYEFRPVSRTDLNPIVNAPGRLESSKRTIIHCELENTTGSGTGRSGAGASTMLTVLPEGTPVKKDDVLATLDSTTYDDLYRQQTITVEEAKSSYLQVQLDLEVALLSVQQYREGTVMETLKAMEGSIALARSDLTRAADHLDWTKRMSEKGYTSPAQIVSEKHSVSVMDFTLKKQLTSLDLFQRFTRQKMEKTLQGDVKAAQTNFNNQTLRLQRQLDRLALLKKQVDRCTIRAPHDGVLYYVKNRGGRRSTPIQEGMTVGQRQELFYLPDLSEMEAQVVLNESIVHRVSAGLRATVRFEALPNLVIEGVVVSVGQIPIAQRVETETDRAETDVRFFVGIVKLDKVAPGLKPGMTTRVDIAVAPRENVLAIPHEAVKSDRGRKVCFVARDETLVRREVRIGQETTDLVEVTDGLEEGDLVALNPPATLNHVEPLMNFDEFEPLPLADTNVADAAQQ